MKEQILAEFREKFPHLYLGIDPNTASANRGYVFANLAVESFLTEALQRIEYDSYIKGYVDGKHDTNPEH